MIPSKLSQIDCSDFAHHSFCEPSASPIKSFTHSVPILAIFAKSAGLSIAGVWSNLKSDELKITPFGVCIACAIVSGILWFTTTNSIVKQPSFKRSTNGSTIFYLTLAAIFGSSNVFLTIPSVNGVV